MERPEPENRPRQGAEGGPRPGPDHGGSAPRAGERSTGERLGSASKKVGAAGKKVGHASKVGAAGFASASKKTAGVTGRVG
jgi:hypothetical protein